MIVPEANFGIEICKIPARNAILLATETDYMLSYQITQLPKSILLQYLNINNRAYIAKRIKKKKKKNNRK